MENKLPNLGWSQFWKEDILKNSPFYRYQHIHMYINT